MYLNTDWKWHLEGLDESPQQRPDALPPAEQLDQSHHPEQAEEGDGDASAVLRVLEVRGERGEVKHGKNTRKTAANPVTAQWTERNDTD